MRKVIFISILIITCILFFLIISFGFKLGPINILGYDEVETANINKKILLNELTNKNEKEFKEKEKELKEVIQDYKETQSAYDELITIKKANKPIEDYLTLYDFDEIWKILENYSKDKNIVLNLDAVKSDTVMAVSSKYNVYDLKFKTSFLKDMPCTSASV